MSTTKARGLVLKAVDMGESNKRLTLFAKELGKITVSARGAKNVKSKFHFCAQQFCYCDFVLYNGNGFTSVAQASLIKNFSVFLNDIDRLAYGSYFLELADKTIMPHQQSDNALLLLLKCLNMLNKMEPKKVSTVFQVKLIDLLGFRLEPDICAVCGNTIKDVFFSSVYGFVCENDKRDNNIYISTGVKDAIKYISCDENTAEVYNKIFMFTAPPSLINTLHLVAAQTIKYQLDICTNSLDLLL